jgi:hypothetical protein
MLLYRYVSQTFYEALVGGIKKKESLVMTICRYRRGVGALAA